MGRGRVLDLKPKVTGEKNKDSLQFDLEEASFLSGILWTILTDTVVKSEGYKTETKQMGLFLLFFVI